MKWPPFWPVPRRPSLISRSIFRASAWPWFYGDQDQDLAALTRRFPGMPVIGAYGTGQIAFHDKNSRQLQNAVVTALYRKDPDVQPQP